MASANYPKYNKLIQRQIIHTKHLQLRLILFGKKLFKKIQLGGGAVQGQGQRQLLMSIFAVNDYIWLATCQSKIYEK